MNTLRTLKKLLFGETWLLPLGIAAVLVVAGILSDVLDSWATIGGFLLLAGVLAVLLASVAIPARTARRSPRRRPGSRSRTG
jgi:membrane protein implicated in regulation of membrane protease activity